MALSFSEIDQGGIKITPGTHDGTPAVVFSGNIELQNPGEVLDPCFAEIHESIAGLGLKEIVLDFSDLEFLNSSGIKSLINWFIKLPQLPEDQRYTLQILSNSAITWQSTTFKSIAMLVPQNVKLL